MGKRYVCERCGTGSIAPGRMAPDDVRRFCIPFSVATGKLLPLICPSRERAKERTRQRAAEKRAKERDALDRRFELSDGVDAREILKGLQRLRVWKNEGEDVVLAVKRMKLKNGGLDPNVAAKDSVAYAVQGIATLAGTAAWIITTRGKTPWEMRNTMMKRKTDEESAKQSLIRAASVEYFGLDESELIRIRQATNRLMARDETGWLTTVQQILTARRNDA